MLTPEATATPIPLTGEVRPKTGLTAQTGARTALDDADWAGSSQSYERGVDNAAIPANLRLQTGEWAGHLENVGQFNFLSVPDAGSYFDSVLDGVVKN